MRHMSIMAILKLARMGHPVLLARAAPVPDPTAPELHRLLADMIETLEDSGGVGLAAPQVHESLRLFIYKVPERRASGAPGDTARPLAAVINPELTLDPGEPVEDWEGCLSIPGLTALIPRAPSVTLRGFDASGNPFTRQASGFHARVIQHEFDHLEGILYPSRMHDLRRLGFNEEIARFRDDLLALPPGATM
jgi:peptide deformylase